MGGVGVVYRGLQVRMAWGCFTGVAFHRVLYSLSTTVVPVSCPCDFKFHDKTDVVTISELAGLT